MRQINRCSWSAYIAWLLIAGAVTSITFAATVTYVYDDAGRLKSVLHDDGTQTSYTLDAAGNRKQVGTTQLARPAAPTALGLTSSSQVQVVIHWTASTTSGVTGYQVLRNGNAVGSQLAPSATSYTDNSVAAGTSYTYTVVSYVGPIDSLPSSSLAVTTPAINPPTIPTNFVATAVSSTTVNLTWTASTDSGPGQPGLQGYHVYRNGTLLASPTTTSYSDSSGSPGTSYTYTVAAYDIAGRTSPTASATATTFYLITDVNGNVLAGASNLYSTQTPCPQGICTTGLYQTYGNMGSRVLIATWASGCAAAPNIVNSSYTVVSGCSIQAPSSVYFYPILPAPPTGFTATVNSYSQITLNWTAATDNGGPGLKGYTLTRNGASLPLVAATATSYVDSSLSPSTAYTYVLAAVDNNNVSTSTVTANGTTPAIVPPPPPTNFTGTAVSSSQINLSWVAPVYSGGAGIKNYNLSRNGSVIAQPTGTSFSDTGLALGTSYSYSITTQDNVNQVSQPVTISVQTNGDTSPPSAPGTPSVLGITATTASVSWAAASDNVGVTNYAYQLNGGSWVSVGNVLNTIVSGLRGVTTYTIAIRANDAAGNIGPASGATSFTTTMYTDASTMTIGSPSAVQVGFKSGQYGSMSPTATTNGFTYTGFNDLFLRPQQGGGYVSSSFSISAASDPGQAWLGSVSALGVTRTGASASYVYSAGTATWTWNIAPFGFSSGTAACTIVHK